MDTFLITLFGVFVTTTGITIVADVFILGETVKVLGKRSSWLGNLFIIAVCAAVGFAWTSQPSHFLLPALAAFYALPLIRLFVCAVDAYKKRRAPKVSFYVTMLVLGSIPGLILITNLTIEFFQPKPPLFSMNVSGGNNNLNGV